jgi:hypothetical protein
VRDGADPVDLPLSSAASCRPAAVPTSPRRRCGAEVGLAARQRFMSLMTLALPVSPQVKITGRDVVRVVRPDWEPVVAHGGRRRSGSVPGWSVARLCRIALSASVGSCPDSTREGVSRRSVQVASTRISRSINDNT